MEASPFAVGASLSSPLGLAVVSKTGMVLKLVKGLVWVINRSQSEISQTGSKFRTRGVFALDYTDESPIYVNPRGMD